MDFLLTTKTNLRTAGDGLAALREQLVDSNHVDAVERGLSAVAGAAEREGFNNLGTFASDLRGMADLLRDRMARVQESVEFLARAEMVLENMIEISAAGLDHRQRSSQELLAELADAGSRGEMPTSAFSTLPPELAKAG